MLCSSEPPGFPRATTSGCGQGLAATCTTHPRSKSTAIALQISPPGPGKLSEMCKAPHRSWYRVAPRPRRVRAEEHVKLAPRQRRVESLHDGPCDGRLCAILDVIAHESVCNDATRRISILPFRAPERHPCALSGTTTKTGQVGKDLRSALSNCPFEIITETL